MKRSWLILVPVLVVMLSTSSAFGLQLITNGNFETGWLDGWSIGGTTFPFGLPGAIPHFNTWGDPELGCKVALVAPPTIFGIQALGTAILYQSFVVPAATPGVSVGFQYLPWSWDCVEYDYIRIGMQYDTGGGAVFDEYVYWGGVDWGGYESPGWQTFSKHYDISGITGPIACSIAFGVTTTQDPLFPTGLFVDNVSVEAVPEPATLLLLGSGLLGMGAFGAIRRRKK